VVSGAFGGKVANWKGNSGKHLLFLCKYFYLEAKISLEYCKVAAVWSGVYLVIKLLAMQVTSDISLKGSYMRRLIQLLLLVFLVTASATGVRASTDCERWFATYKQELAHTKAVQQVEAARRRARLYARRKLAGYVRPNPEPHVPRRHPMSRRETLQHFELACGVLPEESADRPLVAEETPLDFIPGRPLDRSLGMIPEEDVAQLPLNDAPPYSGGYADGGNGPSGDGPPMYYPTGGGAGGGGNGPTPPIPPIPPVPPVVPEPSSYVLMLTGLVAAAGVVRQRFNR
jgi:hypothetical protein